MQPAVKSSPRGVAWRLEEEAPTVAVEGAQLAVAERDFVARLSLPSLTVRRIEADGSLLLTFDGRRIRLRVAPGGASADCTGTPKTIYDVRRFLRGQR
jgi:hypothetical protein